MTKIIKPKEIIPYEPKMENRFIVYFPDEFDIPSYVIKTVTYPKCIMGQGNTEWEPIIFTMYDPVTPSTSQKLHKIIVSNQIPFQVKLHSLGPVGDDVEQWILDDCEIVEIDFGNGDWAAQGGSENIIEYAREITMVIQPKNCILSY